MNIMSEVKYVPGQRLREEGVLILHGNELLNKCTGQAGCTH